MTEPQKRALQLINRMGGEVIDRAIDGRVAISLERRGWVARSFTDCDRLVMTPDARKELQAREIADENRVVRPRDPSSRELVEGIIASQEEAATLRRIPDFADVEPEPDGMTEVCCRAMEDAIVARVMLIEARAGRAYISGRGKHWLAHFCPFCGEARNTNGGRFDVDE